MPSDPTPNRTRSPSRKPRPPSPAGVGNGVWIALAVGGFVLVGVLALLVWVVFWVVVPRLTPTGSPPDVAEVPRPAGNGGPVEPPPPGPWLPVELPDPPPPAAPEKRMTNSIGMQFVWIPAGTFTMGSPVTEQGRAEEEKQHEVEITRPFYLGAFEVTQKQYEKVMGNNPSYFSPTGGGKDKVKNFDTADFPVEQVSWHDAVAFCEKLSAREAERSAGRVYRLPTEAEWEYTCREGGARKGPFHFGDRLTWDLANFKASEPYGSSIKVPGLERTAGMGTTPPNAWDLCEMHGNVWEWCADWYDKDYYSKSPRRDPTGPNTGVARAVRGGSWSNAGRACRAAQRGGITPADRHRYLGFRVVCVLSRAP